MPTQEDYNRAAEETFGTTTRCRRAGWILSNGKMLDFGHRATDEDRRGLDHSFICWIKDALNKAKHYEDWWCDGSSIRKFKNNAKALRFDMGTREMSVESMVDNTITDAQWHTIEDCACQLHPTEGKVYLQLDKPDPDGVGWHSYTDDVPISGDCNDTVRQLKQKLPAMRRVLEAP